MDKKEMKKIVKQLEASKQVVADERVKIDNLIDELEMFRESLDGGLENLQSAVDALSQYC